MWNNTRVTKNIGIDYPIFQGPFGGGLSSVELAAVVSNMGGLGGYGAYTMEANEIYELNMKLRSATNKPYNLNLWVSDSDVLSNATIDDLYEKVKSDFKQYFDEVGIPFPSRPEPFKSRYENQVQVILDVAPPVFSFVFGIPSQDILESCRRRNIKLVGAATTVDEAIALERAGVDMIVASGFEGGGHRPSFLASAEESLHGTFALIQLIKEKINTPIIAAGGIADGRGIAAALTLGAEAVQIGTAFLATEESGALPAHRAALFSKDANYTTLTRAFTGRLGRGLTNSIAKDARRKHFSTLPFPLQSHVMSPMRKAAQQLNKNHLMHFWGGQIAGVLKHKKASKLMDALIQETGSLLNRNG